MKSTIEEKASNLVLSEVRMWEDASAFVTERVEFMIRPLIRQLRKNYWGVFDTPTDPNTGRKKIWPPLTETVVEDTIKNFDLDQKDVKVRSKNPRAFITSRILRPVLHDYLTSINFNEVLDETERVLAIDGTVVWKSWEENGKIKRRTVDLLNFYIDPLAESIEETPAVIERAVVPISTVKGMSGWMNTNMVEGQENITPIDPAQVSQWNNRGRTRWVDVSDRDWETQHVQ